MLVALLLLLVFTLRTTVVSIFSSISRPLVVVISMVFINKRSADAGEYGYYSVHILQHQQTSCGSYQ